MPLGNYDRNAKHVNLEKLGKKMEEQNSELKTLRKQPISVAEEFGIARKDYSKIDQELDK